MPTTATFTNTQNYTIPADVYSIRIRIYGAGGGGEFINSNVALTPTAATSGGNSSFLGLVAGGGQGGGIGGRNAGGNGGSPSTTYNWTTLGATVVSGSGKRGSTNTGGLGYSIASIARNGGYGTPGQFNYVSYITHDYSPITTIHYVYNSSPDLTVGYVGIEGTSGCSVTSSHKHYHVNFNIPFIDSNFSIYDTAGSYAWESDFYGNSWCKQAAGGSTAGPFTVTSGGGPNNTKNTLIYTSEYGWLSFRSDSMVYQYISSFRIYTHYSSSTSYAAGSFVVYDGLPYRAIVNSTNKLPPDNPTSWQLLTLASASVYKPITSGGSTYYTYVTVQKYSYFNVWLCRAGGSTFIKCINFSARGQKEGAVGRGGGGGAAIETTLTRNMLLSTSGTYSPGGSYTVQIGTGGSKGGTGAADGSDGYAELFMYIIPRVTITPNKTQIVAGETVNIAWATTGDADSLTWTAGGITNTNLTSNATLSPTRTTTYSAVATGTLAGNSPVASVTITVYQPPTASLIAPLSLDYNTQGTLSYDTEYANTSITITPTYSYDNGVVTGDAITITPATSAEYGVPGTAVSGTVATSIPYNNYGPRQVQYALVAVGSGGDVSAPVKTVTIIIDELPENVNIPEIEDAFKSQDPVISPNYDVTSNYLEIQDIDIPVEIKSSHPIKVDINRQDNWKDLRSI